MITNFKIFEEINIQPENGDYVILNLRKDSDTYKKLNIFLNNKIGKIIDINKTTTPKIFTIDYGFETLSQIPLELVKFFHRIYINDTDINYCFKCDMYDDEIIFAKTEIELKINKKAKKYNII